MGRFGFVERDGALRSKKDFLVMLNKNINPEMLESMIAAGFDFNTENPGEITEKMVQVFLNSPTDKILPYINALNNALRPALDILKSSFRKQIADMFGLDILQRAKIEYFIFGHFISADKLYNLIEKDSEEYNESRLLLGLLKMQQNDYDDAIDIFKEGIGSYKSVRDDIWEAMILYLILIYLHQIKYDEAHYYISDMLCLSGIPCNISIQDLERTFKDVSIDLHNLPVVVQYVLRQINLLQNRDLSEEYCLSPTKKHGGVESIN